MKHRKWKLIEIWLLAGLLALGLSACGGSEDKPVAGYPDPDDNGPVEGETPPGAVVVDAGPTEEIPKGDQGGLETVRGGLEWRREGGIAGFCDVVTVLAGTATVSNCATDSAQSGERGHADQRAIAVDADLAGGSSLIRARAERRCRGRFDEHRLDLRGSGR